MKRLYPETVVDRASDSVAAQRLQQPAPSFFGHSAAARRVHALIDRAVRAPVPVLIVGPTGTGRLTVARLIHHFGGGEVPQLDVIRPRRTGPVTGLAGFTYLADLEDLPREEQARLPALVGSSRLVLATQLDPRSPEGCKRLDARLIRWVTGGVRIEMPSLRERAEDLEQLALEVLRRMPTPHPVGGITDDALDCMRSYAWDGQFDELIAVLTEAVQRTTASQIELRDLPPRLRVRDTRKKQPDPEAHLGLQAAELRAIRRALGYARGNRRMAARVLGIGKTTLYRKLREYGLD
jgi:DNA-binding NtrC family response regulator